MTVRPTRATRRTLATSILALAAVLALGVAADALAPRASEAQRRAREGRGFLGVSLQELNDDLRDSYDYHGDGVLVSDVTDRSPADEVGIRQGDILVRIGDEEIDDVQDATEYVRSLAPGTRVAITVFRDGNSRSLGRATIGDLDDRPRDDDDEDRMTRRAPRAPAVPRTPRAPRVSPAPRPGVRGFMMNSRGRLGVQTHDLDRDLGAYFDAPDGRGVLILSVAENTPASRAGLKAGDVILGLGDDDVDDTEDLREALRERDAGEVDLRILRNGSRRTIEVELEERRSGSFDIEGLGELGRLGDLGQLGSGDWMGLLHEGHDGHDGHDGHGGDPGDSGDDDGKREVRRHVIRVHPGADGEFEIDGDFLRDMTPEDRARFRERMDRFREEMRELRRELKERRDGRD
jgi:membrane-associated protease RseP (regulator of RpoE activity)